MNIATIIAFFGVLTLAAAADARAQTPKCAPTALSESEAKKLLSSIPIAESAKRQGGELTFLRTAMKNSGEAGLFYFFQMTASVNVYDPLDNGNLGYYAVNRKTGRVVDAVTVEGAIHGNALARAQAAMRQKHCISAQLVSQYEAVAP